MNIAGARRSTRLRGQVTTSADGGPATHVNRGGVQGPRTRLPVAAAAAMGLTTEFTGTALYNNDSMDGPNKELSQHFGRSKVAVDVRPGWGPSVGRSRSDHPGRSACW